MTQLLHVLYEHASGYSLFRVKEFEELGALLPHVEASVADLSKFNSIVDLVAFLPFKSGTNALDNINSISEGILHEDLRLFIETNVPAKKKKVESLLGVADPKLGSAISEEGSLGVTCLHTGAIPEILRGIRFHFHHLIKGMTLLSQDKAQLGLGHAYSRAKVKFNINRVDNMIIQSIALLDQLDKDVNTFSMRIREWYSYHFPELYKLVPEQSQYAKVVKIVKSRKELNEESIDAMEEVLQDRNVALAVFNASKSSMGMDISPIDLLNIERFATRVIDLSEYRKYLINYLQKKMGQVAPNLTALIGETVGARLISHAGSLTNLAKYPASTVQILGAEKALFRALKSRGNTPKYGLIFHSTFIGRAAAQNKGRISRYLANKCSIASRIDCFTEFPNSIFGEHLRKQVEDRIVFYETGVNPKKNIEIMKLALAEVAILYVKHLKKEKKKKKKEKKIQELSDDANISELTNGDSVLVGEPVDEEEDVEEKTPKKKKRKHEVETVEAVEEVTPKKKKKKKQKEEAEEEEEAAVVIEETPSKKKKKKKTKEEVVEEEEEEEEEKVETVSPKKKKKKKKSLEV